MGAAIAAMFCSVIFVLCTGFWLYLENSREGNTWWNVAADLILLLLAFPFAVVHAGMYFSAGFDLSAAFQCLYRLVLPRFTLKFPQWSMSLSLCFLSALSSCITWIETIGTI